MKLYLLLVLIACLATPAYGIDYLSKYPVGQDMMQFGEIDSNYFIDTNSYTDHNGQVWTTQPWNLNQGSGERHYEKFISFVPYYNKVPYVLASLSGFDADKNANQRIKVTVPKVYCDGFILDICTWADTQIYGATVNWISIPYGNGPYNTVPLGWRGGFSGPINEKSTTWSGAGFTYQPGADAGKESYYWLIHP